MLPWDPEELKKIFVFTSTTLTSRHSWLWHCYIVVVFLAKLLIRPKQTFSQIPNLGQESISRLLRNQDGGLYLSSSFVLRKRMFAG